MVDLTQNCQFIYLYTFKIYYNIMYEIFYIKILKYVFFYIYD